MSWLDRLLRRKDKNGPTNSTRRPLYIPADAAKPSKPAPSDSGDTAELRLLKDVKLSVKPDGEAFDPYNTGGFNRSSSWDKISKQKSR